MATELEPLIEPSRPVPETDAFGDAASKLVALLDLPEQTRAILIGGAGAAHLSRLAAGFPDREVHESIRGLVREPSRKGVQFDLALWAFDPIRERGLLEAGLARLRSSLAPGGSVLLLAPNRLSLRRLKRQPTRLLRRGARTGGGYRAAARRAGFASVEEYLPVPGMLFPEEMVASGLPVEVPAHASAVFHTLARFGILAGFHEGFLYHLAGDGPGTARLLARLGASLRQLGGDGTDLRLDRYALRQRGALILSLTDTTKSRPLIARITACEQVDRVIRRNAEWTRWIHASPTLESDMKALIPASLGSVAVGSLNAHVEAKVPGVIAWKIAVGETDSALFDSACAFLRSLARATLEPVVLDEDRLQTDLELPQHGWYDSGFVALLATYRQRLIELMADKTRTYCLSHGDYGYGNLLAHGTPARVSGVIDWDQARIDLAGIDLVNFLVQRHRMRQRVPLLEALRAVWSDLPAGDSGTVVRAVYPEVPGMREPDRRAELFAWLLWRFVERDTRYRQEFDRGRDALAGCLEWALEEMLP